MFISKFAWILVKRSIFVGIILRIIGGFKSIIDLSLTVRHSKKIASLVRAGKLNPSYS